MVTLIDIAKMAGVSPSTVSNILNERNNVGEETKQRVLKIIQETGYEPNYFASSIRRRTTNMVAIVVEDLTIYTMPIVERIMAVLEDAGYKTILTNLRMYDKWQDTWYYDEIKLFSELRGAMTQLRPIKVEGVVYVGGHCRYLRILSEFKDMNLVVAYAISKDNNIPSVVIDDEKGGYEVTDYLLKMGHTRIGVIGGVDENLHTKMRLDGYQRALYEHGVVYNPNLVGYGDWLRHSGYEVAARILKEEPTAIFCMNDYMAAGAYDYCNENGIRIPEDLSIVGYDNVELSEYLIPKLTTCQISAGDIGRRAAEELLNKLQADGKEAAETDDNDGRFDTQEKLVKIDCEVIYRDSVRKVT